VAVELSNQGLTKTLGQLQEERKVLLTQLEHRPASGVGFVENDLGTLHATNEALQGSLADMAAQNYDLREQLSRTEPVHAPQQARGGHEQQLWEHSAEIQRLRQANQDLNHQAEHHQSQISQSHHHYTTMEQRLALTIAECDSLRSSLELSEMARQLAKQEMAKESEANANLASKLALREEEEAFRSHREIPRVGLGMRGDATGGSFGTAAVAVGRSVEAEQGILVSRVAEVAYEEATGPAPTVAERAGDLLGRLRPPHTRNLQPLQSSGVRTPGASDPQERFDAYARAKSSEDESWLAGQQTRSHFHAHEPIPPFIKEGGQEEAEAKLQPPPPINLGFEEKFAALRRNLIGNGVAAFAA